MLEIGTSRTATLQGTAESGPGDQTSSGEYGALPKPEWKQDIFPPGRNLISGISEWIIKGAEVNPLLVLASRRGCDWAVANGGSGSVMTCVALDPRMQTSRQHDGVFGLDSIKSVISSCFEALPGRHWVAWCHSLQIEMTLGRQIVAVSRFVFSQAGFVFSCRQSSNSLLQRRKKYKLCQKNMRRWRSLSRRKEEKMKMTRRHGWKKN
ncbi:hypothetical protein ATANTOWER_017329 [Ataeniobius toweri]|uniref:Uncharacterized protein n=1 Tax=Ataeniobius toweri TaxID=208326 RepID=A0ABU7AAQ5_9TELE|nr:hypothetical protein [Ataeniobius toweri]